MKPHISLIVAKSQNGVIGSEGKLPWHFPEDLKFFKQVTLGKPIIMGRATWESLGRPLPGRKNIVLTRAQNYTAQGAHVVHSLEEALSLENFEQGVFIIGGAKLYKSSLPLVDTAWVTEILEDFEGDTFFPELDSKEWKRVWVEEHAADENRPWPFRFQRFERIPNNVR